MSEKPTQKKELTLEDKVELTAKRLIQMELVLQMYGRIVDDLIAFSKDKIRVVNQQEFEIIPDKVPINEEQKIYLSGVGLIRLSNLVV